MAFSPDGKTLVSGDGDGTVRLWNAASGKEIRTLQGHQGMVLSVAFSPDGRTVASGSGGEDNTVRLWEAATGKEIRTLQRHATKLCFGGDFCQVAFSLDGRSLATTSGDCVQLWDLLSGTAYPPLAGHRDSVLGVAFSADGKALASVSGDNTGLIWDLTYKAARSATKPSPDGLEALWVDLASKDAARACRAVWTLVETPSQSVPLLRGRLRPVPADMGKRLDRLVADLDADEYQVREKARRELEKVGPDAEPTLRKGLEGSPSVELRKRLEQLLEVVGVQNRRGFSGEVLRGLRAVEVLEQIGTPQARQVLKTLAAGAPGFLTQEAQAALRRLAGARQSSVGPAR